MAYTKYSLTPADNNAAPPNGAPEGMLPSAVNDTMRDMMSQIRDVGDGIRGGTYTMTAPVITGGSITGSTINNSAIGGTTAAAGKFTTLEATGVATFSAGTVSAPAITTTGDTNTGIFFPAADTIAFTEGGVESMRIDASGNIGLGSTPKAWSTIKSIDMLGGGASETASFASGFGSTYVVNNAYYNGTSWIANTTSVPTYYSQISGTHQWHTGTSVTAGTATSFSERMRIDSSGNVGIGTSSPTFKLDVLTTGTSGARITTGEYGQFSVSDGVRSVYIQNFASIGALGTGSNNPLILTVNSTERLRIDTSGNVGIGVTPNNNKLVVKGAHSSGRSIMAVQTDQSATGSPVFVGFYNSSDTRIGYVGCQTATDMQLWTAENVPMLFGTNNTERMRIDSSGNLLVGTTATGSTSGGFAVFPAGWIQTSRNSTSSASHIEFRNPNGLVGAVTTSGTTTTYATSSDYRLKENVAPMQNALATVQALKPVTYTWKVDGSSGQGFIAHELQAVVPECVTGEKDAVDAKGKPVYQGIDTSFLVATLTKAIQEQQVMIENLTTRLNALEGN